MTDILRDLIERVRDLKETVQHSMPAFRWGVVTSVSPLAVQLDADTQPLAGSPTTLTTGLQAGDRVLCLQVYRKVTILGVLKGRHGPYAMAAGRGNQPAVAANGGAETVTVTFPVGRFTEIPSVTLSPWNGRITATPQQITTTSFNFAMFNWTTANAGEVTNGINWQAVQMTPTSATG